MFSLKRQETKPSPLDPVINEVISTMDGFDPYSEEYAKMVYNLKTLYEAKAMEPKPNKISVETVAVIAANLVGIAMILIGERTQVITSKGLNFIVKPKTDR